MPEIDADNREAEPREWDCLWEESFRVILYCIVSYCIVVLYCIVPHPLPTGSIPFKIEEAAAYDWFPLLRRIKCWIGSSPKRKDEDQKRKRDVEMKAELPKSFQSRLAKKRARRRATMVAVRFRSDPAD